MSREFILPVVITFVVALVIIVLGAQHNTQSNMLTGNVIDESGTDSQYIVTRGDGIREQTSENSIGELINSGTDSECTNCTNNNTINNTININNSNSINATNVTRTSGGGGGGGGGSGPTINDPPIITDTTTPNVSITSPANKSIVSGINTISANATDNAGVAGVQFIIDNQNINSEDITTPYSIQYNFSLLNTGQHIITAKARDTSGNVKISNPVSITVSVQSNNQSNNQTNGTNSTRDTTRPNVQITYPLNGAVFIKGSSGSNNSGNGSGGGSSDLPFSELMDYSIFDANAHGRVRVGDVNGDGLNDILLHQWATPLNGVNTNYNFDGKLVYYQAPTWTVKTISSTQRFGGDDVKIEDMDEDGDADVVASVMWKESSTDYGTFVYLYKQIDPQANTWQEIIVANLTGMSEIDIKDIHISDIDNDGKKDIAVRLQTVAVVLYQNSLTSWTIKTTNVVKREGSAIGDVDNDGKEDFILNGYWLKNPGGRNNNWIRYNIDSLWYNHSTVSGPNTEEWRYFATRVQFEDINEDGKKDIIFSQSELPTFNITWYETNNPTGGPSAWTKHIVTRCDRCHSLELADFDNDGDLDIMGGTLYPNDATATGEIFIARNNGGADSWNKEILGNQFVYEANVGDIDNDNDIDIISSKTWREAPIQLWRNNLDSQQGTGKLSLDTWQYKLVDSNRTKYTGPGVASWMKYFGIYMDDATNDNFKDIVSGKYFYRNPGGSMTGNWPRYVLPVDTDGSLITDIDGDSFGDIIAFNLPDIYWFESANADGSSWVQRNKLTFTGTNTSHKNPQGWRVANIVGSSSSKPEIIFEGGDGLSAGLYVLEIPTNPTTTSWPLTKVTSYGGDGVGIGDIDNDGDLDLATGTVTLIRWFENPGSLGLWSSFTVGVTDVTADRVSIADIDGDGRKDIVVGEEIFPNPDTFLTKAFWYKNPSNPETGTWTRNIIGSGNGFQSLETLDMDKDNDIDVVVGEHKNNKNMFIYENTGAGTFTKHTVGSGKESHGLYTADIDNDGDNEIANIGWDDYTTLHLWINKNTVVISTPNSTGNNSGNVSNIIQISATASDNVGVAAVQFKIDGQNYGNQDTTPPYSIAWDYSTVSPGLYELTATARDAVGNVRSSSVSITIQNNGSSSTPVDYFVPLTIFADDIQRNNKPVDLYINITKLLSQHGSGSSGAINSDSFNLKEYSESGTLINGNVPFQFDKGLGYNAANNAHGTLVLLLQGTTSASASRYFKFNFGTGTSYTPPSISPLITYNDNVNDEGQSSYKINTQKGTYYYQKMAGAFSSLVDSSGNDWIGFNPTNGSGAGGEFRGIPNSIHPEGQFHPGDESSTSTIVNQGPLKLTIKTVTNNNLWEQLWEIYPEYSRMTMVRNAHEYWFLYEGTPGGSLSHTNDIVVRSSGTQTTAGTTWSGDLSGDEWVYFGDPAQNKALFTANHQSDSIVDSYRPMSTAGFGNMTVFGFGREATSTNKFINTVPYKFTIGLIDTVNYSSASNIIQSAYKETDNRIGIINGPFIIINEPPPTPNGGIIYKEFIRMIENQELSGEWRVTDLAATHNGSIADKPNEEMTIQDVDIQGATKAEALMEVWGGHLATTLKTIRFNGNSWISIPDLGTQNGVPTGRGTCYFSQLNQKIIVPLNNLVDGDNLFGGNSGGQTGCAGSYNFNWGQWGWYTMNLRVYYDANKPHPTGNIISQTSGGTIGSNPVIRVSAQSAAGIDRVDVYAYYDGYDENGDGIFADYHGGYSKIKGSNNVNLVDHVGTGTTQTNGAYEITWDTSLVPDQPNRGIKLLARIKDNNDVWYQTPIIENITLQRPFSVKLYKPLNVPENYIGSKLTVIKFSNVNIPLNHNLAQATSAKLLIRTWNGVNSGGLSREILVNTHSITSGFGQEHWYDYDVIDIPTTSLIPSLNTVTVKANAFDADGDQHHGIEVLWPGPAVIVTYSTVMP